MDLNVLGKNLNCYKYKNVLSLEKIKDETRKGLHSILHIECEKCSVLTQVHTGEHHEVNEEAKIYLKNKKHNDITTSAVLDIILIKNITNKFCISLEAIHSISLIAGTLHAAVGFTEINKILSCLDVPRILQNYLKNMSKK